MGNTLRPLLSKFAHNREIGDNNNKNNNFMSFSKNCIFMMHKDQVWLCDPLWMAFKIPTTPPPDMHVASTDTDPIGHFEVSQIFPWDSDSQVIFVDEREDDMELIRRKVKKTSLAVVVFINAVRAMTRRYTKELSKIRKVSKNVILILVFGFASEEAGRIRNLACFGCPKDIELAVEINTINTLQMDMARNFVWNRSLFDSLNGNFDQLIQKCTHFRSQLDANNFEPSVGTETEEFSATDSLRKLIVTLGNDSELLVSLNGIEWNSGDWIGVFRPHKLSVSNCVAQISVEDNQPSVAVKMYPVPYGDVVLCYYKTQWSKQVCAAMSSAVAFGSPITAKPIQYDFQSLIVELGGDLPPACAVHARGRVAQNMTTEDGKSVYRLEGLCTEDKIIELSVVAYDRDVLAVREIDLE